VKYSPAQSELWNHLEAFEFDTGGVSLSFTRRLARENGWTHAFAHRALREYRRFLFLAMQAGHPVSPSDQVDQVWHLHLCYTRSYWTRLCGEVLGEPLHHEPTQGGAVESGKFDDWYARTIESYRRFFGDPPADLWPSAQVRFGDDLHFRRVNVRRAWIIPKPHTLLRAASYALALALPFSPL
jgi:hypothetical protein